MVQKLCRDCGVIKTASNSYPNPVNPNGLASYCRECDKARTRNYQRTESGKVMMKRHGSKMYLKNKEKALARAKVSNAVKKGKLVKPNYCSACLNEVPVFGHHEDYSKPLEVTWLCDPCHRHTHRRLTDQTLLTRIGGAR